jgi:hypothetical protein
MQGLIWWFVVHRMMLRLSNPWLWLPDYSAQSREDEADALAARLALDEIERNPDSLVSGEDLEARLRRWEGQ